MMSSISTVEMTSRLACCVAMWPDGCSTTMSQPVSSPAQKRTARGDERVAQDETAGSSARAGGDAQRRFTFPISIIGEVLEVACDTSDAISYFPELRIAF